MPFNEGVRQRTIGRVSVVGWVKRARTTLPYHGTFAARADPTSHPLMMGLPLAMMGLHLAMMGLHRRDHPRH